MVAISLDEKPVGPVAPTYRPHLDGLRAVAVYLVVFFHAGSHPFSGGYVGVDVFFVLSGFLVTQLLLRDLAASGSIRFGRFYSRRFRRLLPAAFVALIVTALVFTAIASPAEVSSVTGSFKAAFLYSTNWYFIHQSTGYFGADITTNPVLHFWSLAVEEQFYLLWPLVLGGAFALTRRMDHARRMRTIRIAVAVAAAASAVWALSLRNSAPNRAYYGTDTRAYELLAGALVALVPAFVTLAERYRRWMGAATVASLGALLVVASSWMHLDAIERGVAVTIVTGVFIVALEAADGGIVKRLLSTKSVVYLGKISYGTYLWHWLVILVVIRTFHISTLSTIAIACFVATALASLSFTLLEHPVRTSPLFDRHRLLVIGSGLAVSVLAALLLIPAIVDPARAEAPTAQSSTTAGFTPVPQSPSWRDAKKGSPKLINCFHEPLSKCTVVRGSGPRVLLIGDSNAWMLIPTFEAIARRDNFTLAVAVRGACPWQRDLFTSPVGNIGLRGPCQAEKDDLYTRVLPGLHPDVVVTMNLGYENPALGLPSVLDSDGHATIPGSLANERRLESSTTRSLAVLRANSRAVVLIEPIPVPPLGFDPLVCLSKAKVVEECRYVVKPAVDPLEAFYRRLAQDDTGVFAVNIDRVVCPFLPICDPIVNNQIVRADRGHLAPKFAASIAPQVDAYLKQIGALAR